MAPINLFAPQFHTEEILNEIKDCLDRGWTGLGFKTLTFESQWKNFSGLKNAHFLSSNTAGLHLALKILKNHYGWADGDEIITTPLTFISTNHAILFERLKPVFADIDDYLCLDPASIEARITSKTKAVMFVGIGGNTGQLGAVVDICKKKKLKLILDAAHMTGTLYKNQPIGHEVDVAVFSFHAVKNLPTADSGMICFQDELFDKKARKLSWLGIDKDTYQRFQGKEGSYAWKYDVEDVGFKYHGNSIIAAIGLVQLKYLNQDNIRRRQLASLYDHLLESVDQVQTIKVAPHCESSRHLYQILVPHRDDLIQFFNRNEIYPGVHYRDNTEYPMYAYASGTCPNAARLSQQIISLPLHLRLSDDDGRKVIEVLKQGLKN